MKDTLKMQITDTSVNNSMANVVNVHTCTASCTNLITAIIFIMHRLTDIFSSSPVM